MKISEVAKLTGITVRTLHYYDEIGLLKPSNVTEAGYRVYSDIELDTLQQILFFRELGFSLKDIKEIMLSPHYDREKALEKQRQLLLQKRNQMDKLISLVESTLKGEHDMSFRQFDTSEIEANKKEYITEAKQRWGESVAYAEYKKKTSNYNKTQWEILSSESESLLQEFAQNRHLDPHSKEAQILVQKWQVYITANYYNCTKEILSFLGQMYMGDERFLENIDKYGTGTATFMASAIEFYCRS